MQDRNSSKEGEKAAADRGQHRPSTQIVSFEHEPSSSNPSHERLHNAIEPPFADGRVNRQDVPFVRQRGQWPPAIVSAPTPAPEPPAVPVTLWHIGLSSIWSPDSKSSELNVRGGPSPPSGTLHNRKAPRNSGLFDANYRRSFSLTQQPVIADSI